ncbi:glycosyltransferase [Pontimicrobium aquaticum]|uniref:Glycosyltransferase n=1 Tax=Pontimicrobium aquaticum TaxID=2565367 RepID=A0A4U0F3K7_9FLAO|nr:glycosyltransferase [Pontimicrobium aquaticum]TJY37322.1 glycosyltransferase [Pontimicrobium aquaticum]
MIVLNALFYTFITVVIIQLLYYSIFSQFILLNHYPQKQKNIAVSVLVCAKNEAKNLKEFIPLILDQDYPSFELVLINDCSNDETLAVMKSFQATNNNIKIVDVKPIEAFWGNKKYALTLGIKASSNNFLLFTDADCKPLSKNWIKEMSSHFTNKKRIVLGYGAYRKGKGFLNKLIRFETLLTAIQCFSYAKIGMPYMAVGRNLAYRKETFFEARGFMNHMNVRSGDDDLFVNQIADATNTTICISKDSFTESIPKHSLSEWITQKKRHVSTAKYYKLKHKLILGLFYVSQILFWILSLILLMALFNWKIVLGLILVRFIVQYIIIGMSAKKLNEKDLLIFLPVVELFLIVSQMAIFISNNTSKHNRWK